MIPAKTANEMSLSGWSVEIQMLINRFGMNPRRRGNSYDLRELDRAIAMASYRAHEART